MNTKTSSQKDIGNPIVTGFDNRRDDHEKFISAYFDGPYETAFRKHTRNPEEPDSRTLTDLVNEICRK